MTWAGYLGYSNITMFSALHLQFTLESKNEFAHSALYFINIHYPLSQDLSAQITLLFSTRHAPTTKILCSTLLLSKQIAGVLDQVGLARVVLGIPGVELHHALSLAESRDIDVDGIRDHVPGDTLVAGRGSQGAGVLVDVGLLDVGLQGGEVEGAGLGLGSGRGDLVDVGKDGGHDVAGGLDIGNLDHEANNSQVLFC